MNELDFINLSWKKFTRSRNFHNKIYKRLFFAIGYLIFSFYAFVFTIGGYFIVSEKFPNSDPFEKLNSFLYIFLLFVLYVTMFIPNNSEDVRSFMLLNIKKSKIIKHHILRIFFSPINIILFVSIIGLSVVLLINDYKFIGIFSWLVAILSTLFIINMMLSLGEKNQIIGAVISLGFVIIVWKYELVLKTMQPIGKFYFLTYKKPIYTLILLFLAFFSYLIIFKYLQNRFYLDSGFNKNNKKIKLNIFNWSWLESYGKIGSFLINDIRLISRSPRTQQMMIQYIIMYVFGLFVLGTSVYENSKFWKVYFAFLITGYFIISFGALIPSWDGKYFKLLMSQNIKYSEYLKAKWWLMVVSVLVLTFFSLPYLYFGIDIFVMILAMAMLNIGFNSFVVLSMGVLNTTAIDLDKKIKAFQSQQSFKLSMFIFSILRLLIPTVIYLVINNMYGTKYANVSMIIVGVTGLLLKNIILDKISNLYKKRKYNMISAYSSEDE